ncbi:hypothetical protein L9F63_015878 [Diploptera punctata]|uniref:Major facilitator superfamily (MFS) profile domain-containing protein n=1 Tax=Diploptera punctata TaxID=6984 RepID=A0AAD8A4R9_DIPPU|nr:hypothetical protein L9F63_015878 [Diploptera punctata]
MAANVTSPLVQNGGVKIAINNGERRLPTVTKSRLSPVLKQWLSAVGPLAGVISSGMTAGYSTVLLPQLQEKGSGITVSEEEGSWIASTAVLSMAFGCVLSGPLMDRVGRKVTHQMMCIPFILGWILLAGWSWLPMLYVGRFLTGLSVGVMSPVSTVYIAETAGPKARGPLLAAVSFCVSLGVLLVHLLGTYLSWDRVSIAAAFLPLVCLICTSVFPDTPQWLHSVGREHEARRVFTWFRGDDVDSAPELKKHDGNSSSGGFWKPFLIMCLFFAVQQWSGVNAVTFYTINILREVGLQMDEYVATLVIDAVRLFFSTAACYLLKVLNRRTLSAVSGIGSGTALLAFALLGNRTPWLPVLSLGAYVAFVSVGLVPLPWLMIGEVFPLSSRGIGCGLSSCFGFLAFFLKLGGDWTFAVYGLVSLLGTGLLLLWLPETRNRTLQEIEEDLRR